MFGGVLDYVAGHYVLNTRNDTEYWRTARESVIVPERLQQLLKSWDGGGDFTKHLQQANADKVYSHASWYCLLAGMGRFPKLTQAMSAESRKLLHDVDAFCTGNLARFEVHRDYLERLAVR